MQITLGDFPDKFHHWNNGITIICDKIEVEGNSVSLTFNEGSGICNGGHTYFSIVDYPRTIAPEAHVHLEVIDLPDTFSEDERKSVINDIAKNRNANRALKLFTQANFLGYFDFLKEGLGELEDCVHWHEGDADARTNALKPEFLIQILSCTDPFHFAHPVHNERGKNHQAAATGPGAMFSNWFDGGNDIRRNLKHMGVLAKELLEIRETIALSIIEDDFSPGFRRTAFYKEWLKTRLQDSLFLDPAREIPALPNPASIMILGAFRSAIWIGLNEEGEAQYVGVVHELFDLWSKCKVSYINSLCAKFQDADNDPAKFIRLSDSYNNQFLSMVYGMSLPTVPCRFVDTNSGKSYKKSTDESGDCWLKIDVLGNTDLFFDKPEGESLAFIIDE